MKKKFFGLLLFCTLLSLVVGFNTTTSINGTTLVRYHGNRYKNQIIFGNNITSVSFLTIREDGIYSGRRVESEFSIKTFPWWRVSRLSPISQEVDGIQLRVGILGIVEYQESLNGSDGLDYTDSIIDFTPLWNSNWSLFSKVSGFGDDLINYFVFNTSSEDSTIQISSGIASQRAYVTQVGRTLSPDNWEWKISLNNFPLKGNYSRLAIKCVLEHQGPSVYRSVIPIPERDNLLDNEDDILILSSPNQTVLYEEDTTDKGFFSWILDPTESGGLYPEITSLLEIASLSERTLAVVNSPIFTPDQDIVPVTPDGIIALDDTTNGRVPEEQRYFIYFSFLVTQPDIITWEAFVGLDELATPSILITNFANHLFPNFVIFAVLLSLLLTSW